MVLPYLSIINEKTDHLAQLLAPLRARVKVTRACGWSSAGRAAAGAGKRSRPARVGERPRCLCTPQGYVAGGDESGQPLAARGGETVAVCTIEKSNVCVNRLAQEGRLGEWVCELALC